MTYATVRAAAEHVARQGHLLPHQLAALTAHDQRLTDEQRQAFTDDWRAAGSPAAPVPTPPVVDWRTPAAWLVRQFEGCKLTAYPDPGSGGEPWTIGWGSTTIGGKVVRPGQVITQEQADAQLAADLQRFYDALVRAIPAVSSWAPNRAAALVSWTYNVGVGAMQASTLRRRMLAGEDPAVVAQQELPRWNKASGVVLPGLTRRRNAEVAMFTGAQPEPGPREWATRIQALNLSQPDARTCQAACIAMAVGDRDITGIRRRLEGLGSAGDPAVMRKVIQGYGRRYEYAGNACLEDVYGWLKAGEFLITHGWFTRSGHVICLDGLREAGGDHQLNVKDPWSEFNVQTWAYDLGSRFFDGFYSDLLIYATCVAGVSSEDARQAYRLGVVNPQRRGMWVHRFIP